MAKSKSGQVAVDLASWKAALLQEKQRFELLKPALLRTHLGQFVAIKNGQVVDADRDQIEVARRVRQKYPDVPVLIIEVAETPRVFHMRSPRRVR
jgi:hypothetical protein